jgi:dienelactone hydrolase
MSDQQTQEQVVSVRTQSANLEGSLVIPVAAQGIVLFAHGSGSSRHSPRNLYVAKVLQASGLATLLLDLLTPAEEEIDGQTAYLRFNIGLLAKRLVGATDWLAENPDTQTLKVGYFGASTGAAAAFSTRSVAAISTRTAASISTRSAEAFSAWSSSSYLSWISSNFVRWSSSSHLNWSSNSYFR